MATQKLMPERIVRTEEKKLSDDDIKLLKTKRNKQLLFLLSGYLPFIVIGIYMAVRGADVLNDHRHRYGLTQHIVIDNEQKSSFWTVLPYFLGGGFIVLNIYFGKLYFQSLRPLLMDIRLNKKQLLYFKPAKNPMDFFNKYYLSTPLYQNQQIEVSRDDFNSISDDAELHIEVGPNSQHILRLCNGNKEIRYY